jgi:hypothetical protein
MARYQRTHGFGVFDYNWRIQTVDTPRVLAENFPDVIHLGRGCTLWIGPDVWINRGGVSREIGEGLGGKDGTRSANCPCVLWLLYGMDRDW